MKFGLYLKRKGVITAEQLVDCAGIPAHQAAFPSANWRWRRASSRRPTSSRSSAARATCRTNASAKWRSAWA